MEREDPKTTITRWRMVALSEPKTPAWVEPSKVGEWPDEESQMAATRLSRMGIEIPWGYGREFGEKDFKVIGLRAGGIGVVFFVESTRFGARRLYAAKTLNSFLEPDYLGLPVREQEKISKAFLEEALPWLEMGQNPHIVPVHLLQNIIHPRLKRNVPFVFSEFMSRGCLCDYLKNKGRLDLKESLALGIQLCDGLLHAYEHGLKAHLDLKPDNIMVFRDEVFKVTDFSANVIGTPGYMAPEQVIAWWRKQGKWVVPYELPIDQRADQFSVGLVVLESSLGRQPFSICRDACMSLERAREYVEKGVGEIADDSLPKKVKNILVRAFSPKPKGRFSELSALRKELVGAYETKFRCYEVLEVEGDDSANRWFDRGMAYCNIGRAAFAEEPFRQALKRWRSIAGTESVQVVCLIALGNVYGMTSRFDEAEAACKQALGLLRTSHGEEFEEAQEARLRTQLGQIYKDTGCFDEAEAALREALRYYMESPGETYHQAICIKELGSVYRHRAGSDEAEAAYKQALKLFKKVPGAEEEQAACLMELGNLYRLLVRFDEAENALSNALNLLSGIAGTERAKAICRGNLGALYIAMDRPDKAEAILREALILLCEISGTELQQATCRANLGTIYINTGNRSCEAETMLKGALEVFRGISGRELDQARSLANLAVLHYRQGNSSQAHKFALEALKLCEAFPAEATAQIGFICQEILEEIGES